MKPFFEELRPGDRWSVSQVNRIYRTLTYLIIAQVCMAAALLLHFAAHLIRALQ